MYSEIGGIWFQWIEFLLLRLNELTKLKSRVVKISGVFIFLITKIPIYEASWTDSRLYCPWNILFPHLNPTCPQSPPSAYLLGSRWFVVRDICLEKMWNSPQPCGYSRVYTSWTPTIDRSHYHLVRFLQDMVKFGSYGNITHQNTGYNRKLWILCQPSLYWRDTFGM